MSTEALIMDFITNQVHPCHGSGSHPIDGGSQAGGSGSRYKSLALRIILGKRQFFYGDSFDGEVEDPNPCGGSWAPKGGGRRLSSGSPSSASVRGGSARGWHCSTVAMVSWLAYLARVSASTAASATVGDPPCNQPWSRRQSYKMNDRVSSHSKNYVCIDNGGAACGAVKPSLPRAGSPQDIWKFEGGCSDVGNVNRGSVTSPVVMPISAPVPVHGRVPEGWKALEECPDPFRVGMDYRGGDRVEVQGFAYECNAGSASASCRMGGYEPGQGPLWQEAWIGLGPCSHDVERSPLSTLDFADEEGCPEPWSASTKYQDGDFITQGGIVYECMVELDLGKCSLEEFAPGFAIQDEASWKQAWRVVGSCEGVAALIDSEQDSLQVDLKGNVHLSGVSCPSTDSEHLTLVSLLKPALIEGVKSGLRNGERIVENVVVTSCAKANRGLRYFFADAINEVDAAFTLRLERLCGHACYAIDTSQMEEMVSNALAAFKVSIVEDSFVNEVIRFSQENGLKHLFSGKLSASVTSEISISKVAFPPSSQSLLSQSSRSLLEELSPPLSSTTNIPTTQPSFSDQSESFQTQSVDLDEDTQILTAEGALVTQPFAFVGYGQCIDSQNRLFDYTLYTWSSARTPSYCWHSHCALYTSNPRYGLAGFQVNDGKSCVCLYYDHVNAKPPHTYSTSRDGKGEITDVINSPSRECYKVIVPGFKYAGFGYLYDRDRKQYKYDTSYGKYTAYECGSRCISLVLASNQFLIGFEVTDGECACRYEQLGYGYGDVTSTSGHTGRIAYKIDPPRKRDIDGFNYVGVGYCRDVNFKTYTRTVPNDVTNDQQCADRCVSSYDQGRWLLGFEFDTEKCRCLYSNDSTSSESGSGVISKARVEGNDILSHYARCYKMHPSLEPLTGFQFAGPGTLRDENQKEYGFVEKLYISSAKSCATTCSGLVPNNGLVGFEISATCVCRFERLEEGSSNGSVASTSGDRGKLAYKLDPPIWGMNEAVKYGYSFVGFGTCQDSSGNGYDGIEVDSMTSYEDLVWKCESLRNSGYLTGFWRHLDDIKCLFSTSTSSSGTGEISSTSFNPNQGPSFCYKKLNYSVTTASVAVYLVLTSTSANKLCLTAGENSPLSFKKCDDESTPFLTKKFMLQPESRSTGQFYLRSSVPTLSSFCVSVDDSADLSFKPSCDIYSLWQISGSGRIVLTDSPDYCISRSTGGAIKVVKDCASDASSLIAIIPVPSENSNTYTQDRRLLNIFPKSGFQMSGVSDSFKISGYDVPLKQETILSFYATSSQPKIVDACVFVQNKAEPFCVDLFGTEETDPVITSPTDEYELLLFAVLKDHSDYNSLEFTGVQKIVAISFNQSSSSDTSISRFHSISVYSPGTAKLEDRSHSTLKFKLQFQDEGLNLTNVQFQSVVNIQDEEGNYDVSVPVAEKLSRLDEDNTITISSLIPGRRYQIEFLPVDPDPSQPAVDGNVKAIAKDYTSCTSNANLAKVNEKKGKDETGAPVNLVIRQGVTVDDAGLISFEYTHNSVCARAYAMTRQDVTGNISSDPITFTPLYLFEQKSSESNGNKNSIQPSGNDFKDRVSFLRVGNTYEYCVAAVAEHYMVDSAVDDGRFAVSSDEECKRHTVQWESTAFIKVTLKKESGSEPVEDVTVLWELLSPDGSEVMQSGTEFTPPNGLIGPIHLKVQSSEDAGAGFQLSDFTQLPLSVTFTKFSSGGDSITSFPHTFLCDNESIVCPDEGFKTYLSHLGFGQTIHAADATTISIYGTVYAGRKAPGGGTIGTGCGLSGVTMSLYRYFGNDQVMKVDSTTTDKNGEYSMKATIGTRVFVEASMSGHSFDPMDTSSRKRDDERASRYKEKGYFASSEAVQNGEFSNHDFYDTTLAPLTVEIAGGLCDIELGNAKIEVTLENCDPSFYMQEFDQATLRGTYEVPAHVVNVNLLNIYRSSENDLAYMLESLKSSAENTRLDLTDLTSYHLSEQQEIGILDDSGEETNRTSYNGTLDDSEEDTKLDSRLDESEEETNLNSLVRFQYDGVLFIEPQIRDGMDKSGSGCHSHEVLDIVNGESRSRHVIPSKASFDIDLYVKQLIIRNETGHEQKYCDLVGNSTELYVENNVGLDPTLTKDAALLSELQLQERYEDVLLYSKCTEASCSLPIEISNEEESVGRRSKATIKLKAGFPKTFEGTMKYANYSKPITITSENSRHIMYIVVTGDYGHGQMGSFPMPTLKPLLVIRDPPGGLSSVSYSNVHTTVKISVEEFEKYEGVDGGFSIAAKFKSGAKACVGAIVGYACTGAVDAEANVGPELGSGRMWLTDFNGEEHSHTLNIVWSYQTSDDQGLAGKLSDVFLVPTLVILLQETETVLWNETSCTASKLRSIKFDIGSEDTRQALNFLTYDRLTSTVLPNLRDNLELIRRNETEEYTPEQLYTTNASIVAWDEVLKEYEDTYSKSFQGELDSVSHWFSSTIKERPTCEKARVQYYRTYVTNEGTDAASGGLEENPDNQKVDESNPEKVSRKRKRWGYKYRCKSSSKSVQADANEFINHLCSGFSPQDNVKEVTGDYDDIKDQTSEIECIPKDAKILDVLEWDVIPSDDRFWIMWDFKHATLDKSKHKTPLVSPELKDKEEKLDSFPIKYNEYAKDLASISTVQFSGGGSLLSFEFSTETSESYQSLFQNPFNPDANSDFHLSVGAFGDLEIAVGMGLLAGIGFDFSLAYETETSHRMNFGDESSDETVVTVELGDPDSSDYFLLDIALDPKHSTFVFHTIEGMSKCPHEVNTTKVEDPYVSVLAESKPKSSGVSSDDAMVFELEIVNKGASASSFYLYHETSDNPHGLSIDFFGNDVGSWSLEGDGKAQKTTVSVAMGPKGYLTYGSVRVHLQSQCEFDGAFGSAIRTTELYNVEQDDHRYIEFTEPCAEVEFSENNFGKRSSFSVNSLSTSVITISITNPSIYKFPNKKLREKRGLSNVWLQYRKVSERADGNYEWSNGLGADNEKLDFLSAEESAEGLINSYWRYPKIDGYYEIRLKSECSCGAGCPANMRRFISESVYGHIDTDPPRVFGKPTPSSNLQPGEEITIVFTEDIECDLPYSFDITIQVSEIFGKMFLNDDLDILCNDNTISIQFNEESIPGMDYNKLYGRTYGMLIKNVKDKSGNKMEEAYVFSSNFICQPPIPKLQISHDATRQYLPHEPIKFHATLSNYQEKWVTVTTLSMPVSNMGRTLVASDTIQLQTVDIHRNSSNFVAESAVAISRPTSSPTPLPTSPPTPLPTSPPTPLPSPLPTSLPTRNRNPTRSLISIYLADGQQVAASDQAVNDFYGRAVAISGHVAIVGANGDDDLGSASGSAYIFRWKNNEWLQEAKLKALDGSTYDGFGYSVGIDGNIAVVGACYDDIGEFIDGGSAYVYRWNNIAWSQEAKLTASVYAGGDRFGYSVAISDDTIIVGTDRSPSVYLFRLNTNVWNQEAQLTSPDGVGGSFGNFVSLSGNVAVVSAFDDASKGAYTGSAYVFRRNESNQWNQEAKLVSSDAAAGDYFGYSVGISDDTIVLGAIHDSDKGSKSGSVYVFRWNTVDWNEDAKLVASDGAAGDKFGVEASISGDVIVVGSRYDDDNGVDSGSVYVFRRRNNKWREEDKFIATNGVAGESFGYRLAISGETVLVGSAYREAAYFFSLSPPSTPLLPSDWAPGVSNYNNGNYYGSFGAAVDISNDVAIVGRYGDDDKGSFSGSAYIFRWSNGAWNQEAKLVASDGTFNDYFGKSVSISGDVAIVGVEDDDDLGSSSGSVYVYRRSGTQWIQEVKLVASDGTASDYFGKSVAIDGNIIIVGTPYDDDKGSNSGSTYVFRYSGSQWIEEAKLVPIDAVSNDGFGWSVAISGSAILVGCLGDDDNGSSSGSAYVFRYSSNEWIQEAKLIASDGGPYYQFGLSVGISGDIAIVGAYWDESGGSRSGSAYIFRHTHGQWIEEMKLLASDGAANDNFGKSVAISGNVAIIGSPRDDDADVSSGSAYVFRFKSGQWSQEAKLDGVPGGENTVVQGNPSSGFGFGHSVAVSGELAVVGSSLDIGYRDVSPEISGAFGYELTPRSSTKVSLDGAASDKFGNSVAISGDVAIVSAFKDDDNGDDSGSVYILRWDSGQWSQEAKLVASDGSPGDMFGYSVGIDSNVVVIGAFHDDDDGDNSGSAYVFRRNAANVWVEEDKLVASDGDSGDFFGCSVAVSGGAIIVGAQYDEDDGTNSGSAYIFHWDAVSWNEQTKLLAPDGGVNYRFGTSVDISNNFAVVGAFGDSSFRGSAHVFHYGDDGHWSHAAKLVALDGSTSDYFGMSVAISGSIVIVGASGDDDNGIDSGSVYIFRDTGNEWTQESKLVASDGASGNLFGKSVAINSDVVVVGSYKDNDVGVNSGSAYLFRRSNGQWSQESKLIASNGASGDYFGSSVAVGAETAIVGSIYRESVSIFYLNPSPTTNPSLSPTATASDSPSLSPSSNPSLSPTATASDSPSFSPSSNPSLSPTSMPSDSPSFSPSSNPSLSPTSTPSDSPSFSPSSNPSDNPSSLPSLDPTGIPSLMPSTSPSTSPSAEPSHGPFAVTALNGRATLVSPSQESGDRFGYAVAIDRDVAVVGCPYSDSRLNADSGHVFVFRWEEGSSVWTKEAELEAPKSSNNDEFGFSVGISESSVIVGSRLYQGLDDINNDFGAAFVFHFSPSSMKWHLHSTLIASDANEGDSCGTSVAISGLFAIVGCPNSGSTGAAFLYHYDVKSDAWVEKEKLTAPDAAAGDKFGSHADIDGNVAVVAIPNKEVHVYRRGEGENDLWSHEAILSTGQDDVVVSDLYGTPLKVSGDFVIVGAPSQNTVLVHRWDLFDGWLNETATLTPGDDGNDGDNFGFSLDMSDNTIIVGSCKENLQGAAYVFLFDETGKWSQKMKFTADDGKVGDHFGATVAISETNAVVGSPLDDGASWDDSGSVAAFNFIRYYTTTKVRDGSDAMKSYLELGVDLRTNQDDFTILVNGEPLVSDQIYVLGGDETVSTAIAVLKGTGNALRYPPISLYLRSHCDSDSHNPNEVTADLWNWQDDSEAKFIKFIPPCPAIEWSGIFEHESEIVLGREAIESQGFKLEITIFNPGHVERKLFHRSVHNLEGPSGDMHLKDIVLLYRRANEKNMTHWEVGTLMNAAGNALIGDRAIDFSMDGIEDDFGYATLFWDLSAIDDSRYVVKVTSRCDPSVHQGLQDYDTKTVQLAVDTMPPSVYSSSLLMTNPNQEFIVRFTEDIECGKPFVFDLELVIALNGFAATLRDGEGILVDCEGKSIKFVFHSDLFGGNSTYFDQILKSDIQVRVSNVEDLAGNHMLGVFESSITGEAPLCSNSMEPVISLGFDHQPDADFFDEDGKFLHVRESPMEFENVGFWFTVSDDCPQTMEVEIKVKSNEFEYSSSKESNMVLLRDMDNRGQSRRIQIFVEPKICPRSGTVSSLCETDPDLPVRSYEINVKATNIAGRSNTESASVIIIPENSDEVFFSNESESLKTPSYFINLIAGATGGQYIIQTISTQFDVE